MTKSKSWSDDCKKGIANKKVFDAALINAGYKEIYGSISSDTAYNHSIYRSPKGAFVVLQMTPEWDWGIVEITRSW